jgi:hypothetical protein
MFNWVESLPTAGAGAVIVGGFLLAALAVGYVVGSVVPREVRTNVAPDAFHRAIRTFEVIGP